MQITSMFVAYELLSHNYKENEIVAFVDVLASEK